MKNERGSSLIEVIIALAILSVVGVAFLSGLATTSRTRVIADEQVSARILAESQMENLKEQTYAFSYDPVPVPLEFAGYSSEVNIDNMRNGHIQKISVTVTHNGKDIITLENYKVNR